MEVKDILEQKFDALGKQIDAKIEQAAEAQKNESLGTFNDIKSDVQGMVEKYNKLQEQIDAVESGMNRTKSEYEGNKSWVSKVNEQIKSDSDFMEKVKSGGFTVNNLRVKAETVLSSATDLLANSPATVDVVAAQRGRSGVIFDPDRAFRVRSLIPQSSTSSNKIDYVEENAFSDGTSWVAEGANIDPNSHFDLVRKSVQVEEFQNYVRIPRAMLEDIDGLMGYINSRLVSKWGLYEDGLLLRGENASTPDHLGITEVASAYVDNLADANVNNFDIIAKAIQQAQVAEYQPNAILLHPNDYYNLLLTKATDGHYVFPDQTVMGLSAPRIAGVPLISTTAMTADTFLVGDFTSSQIYDRNTGSIRIYEQDRDNAIKRLVTIEMSARMALVNYRPSAYIYGTFAAAKANGSA